MTIQESIIIKNLHLKTHDTSFGGYKLKYVAMVTIPSAEFKKLKGRLGRLVADVNNKLYSAFNIPAHGPSVEGATRRAKNGVKTLIFTYFSNNCELAQSLGMEMLNSKDGLFPKYGNCVNLMPRACAFKKG